MALTVENVLNANPIGYASEKMGNPLNKGLVREPISETVDTRGMYYADEFTPEISGYREDIGTIGNLRHATSAAQYKDMIAQALTPMKHLGAKPGWIANTVGGIGANILGLGHEVKGLTKDWSQIKDPDFWKTTGEDVLANLYGSIKGKTGVSEQEIYDDMLGNFIYGKGIMSNVLDWGTLSGDKTGHPYNKKRKGMTLQRFRDLYQTKKNRRKQDMQQKIQQGEAAQQVQQNIQTYGNRDRPNTGMNAPGAGKGQSPTGGDVSGTPFVRGGRVSYFDGGLASSWPR